MRFPNRSTWACAALAFALAASGCGDESSNSSDAPADDPETVAAVTKKIDVAAGRIANSTPDRNLPGPYAFKTVCLTPDEARSFGTPRESVQCHIEAFTTPGKGRTAGAYVWSEDWRVPVQDGQLGDPEIVGEYRIRNFLRKDHRLNCSGGKTPQERCTGVYKAPAEETPIPGSEQPIPGSEQPIP